MKAIRNQLIAFSSYDVELLSENLIDSDTNFVNLKTSSFRTEHILIENDGGKRRHLLTLSKTKYSVRIFHIDFVSLISLR